MNILVFGGSGFLGSYLIDEIISRGYSVVNADIRPPKYNIERQKYLFVDILNLEEVFKTVDSSFDCVYNLAGMSDLNESVNKPKETYELNIIGHINILEACISNKIKHYIYSSSAYVYSLQGSHYGISKLLSFILLSFSSISVLIKSDFGLISRKRTFLKIQNVGL